MKLYLVRFIKSILCLLIFLSAKQTVAQDVTKAYNYYKAKEYKLAAIEFENAIPEYELSFGDKDTTNLSKLIFFTAMSYDYVKDFKKAEHYYLSCIDIYKRVKSSHNSLYIQSSVYLANIYYQFAISAKKLNDRTESFSNAERLYLEVEKIYIKHFGKYHYNYAENCNNLAYLYNETGDNQKALTHYKEAKEIILKIYGEQHADYATSLNNLALFLLKLGQYKDVESLYLKSKNIYETNYGKNHTSYALSCNNLAGYYATVGNLKKAKALYLESHSIYKKNKAIYSLKFANSCKNLAIFYEMNEEFDEVEELLNMSKDINSKILGNKNIEYAKSCSNLALYYFRTGKYLKAIKFLSEAKKLIVKITGKNSPDYARALNNSAQIHRMLGNIKEAESYFIESMKITDLIYGNKHGEYAGLCSNLGALYESIGKYKKAEEFYIKANDILNIQTKESSLFLSEKEREEYIAKTINDNFNVFYSFFLFRQNDNKELSGIVYNNALLQRGLLLKSATALRKLVLASGDTALINTYDHMNKLGEIIAKQYSLPKSERYIDLTELEEKINNIEKELIRKTSILPDFEKMISKKIAWQDIQKSLKKDEIAIEFIHFDYRNHQEWTDSTLYYAILLHKDYDYPKPVFVFEERQVKKLLKRPLEISEYNFIKDLYDPKSLKADSLYKLVWQPLEKHLQNIKDIYLSPSGILNKISFDALPYDSSKIISDKYKIIYNSGTSEIVNKTGLYQKDIKSSVLFGGIDYNIKPKEMEELAAKFITTEENRQGLTRSLTDSLTRNLSWSYLPGSLEETEEIQDVLKKKNIYVKFYTAKQGSEEQFKALEKDAPSILHVSTHGFYFGDDEKSIEKKALINQDVIFAYSDNPLLRSGFILAGGNTAFQGKDIPKGVEDGVLTALEISRLNFFKTKLVVLSACQTGLGDVKGSEGVYGLQRSFKMAGVDYLLFSLWEVPDEATKELMTKFYEFWFSGLEIRDAFKKAQDHLKEKYKDIPGSEFAWAAFVLMK